METTQKALVHSHAITMIANWAMLIPQTTEMIHSPSSASATEWLQPKQMWQENYNNNVHHENERVIIHNLKYDNDRDEGVMLELTWSSEAICHTILF